MIANDTNGCTDVFVADVGGAAIERVSTTAAASVQALNGLQPVPVHQRATVDMWRSSPTPNTLATGTAMTTRTAPPTSSSRTATPACSPGEVASPIADGRRPERVEPAPGHQRRRTLRGVRIAGHEHGGRESRRSRIWRIYARRWPQTAPTYVVVSTLVSLEDSARSLNYDGRGRLRIGHAIYLVGSRGTTDARRNPGLRVSARSGPLRVQRTKSARVACTLARDSDPLAPAMAPTTSSGASTRQRLDEPTSGQLARLHPSDGQDGPGLFAATTVGGTSRNRRHPGDVARTST